MNAWTNTLLAVGATSLISLIGIVALLLKKEFLKKILFILVSFAVGGLFGDAIIHLLPDSFEIYGFGMRAPAFILLGIGIFFVLEKFIRWRHCHAEPCEEHAKPLVAMNFVGDAAHNLIDGMLIAASFQISPHVGITTTIAIILHEIPHELGNFGVFVHGGLSPLKAIGLNFASALTAFVGAIVALILGEHISGFAEALLPITAGGFIYVAGSDLIPELHHDTRPLTSLLQLLCILAGIGIMLLLIATG